MFEMEMSIDVPEVRRRLGALADQADKVIARAVNRAYPTGKKAIWNEAKENYRITEKDVNSPKTLKITKARPHNPVASLKYTGGHRNLYLWNNEKAVSPKVIIRWSHGKPNVKVYRAAVAKGHAKIALMGDNKPFVQKVRKGEKGEFVGLFRRETSARDAKLVSVTAPAVPQILKNAKIMAQFRRAAGPMLQKRLEHEIDVVLKGVVR